MWDFQQKMRSGINVGFFAVYTLVIYSTSAYAIDSALFKSRPINDQGFLDKAKERLSFNSECFNSDFRDRRGITPVSTDDSYCNTENHGVAGFHFTADNPHLRLDIMLKRIEHQNISGSETPSIFGTTTFVDIQFESLSADLMSSNMVGLLHYVGDTVANPPLPIYTLFIENGCVGSPPATFDLALTSHIYSDLDKSNSLGSVQLYDEVVGHGYYNFSYTIRAEGDDGNISDFTFSGDANSTCADKITLY